MIELEALAASHLLFLRTVPREHEILLFRRSLGAWPNPIDDEATSGN
jgi:hypothetical protein